MTHPLDTQNMEKVIAESPRQFRAGLKAAKDVKVPGGPFGSVLLAGMGGSWMAGALVREAKLSRVPIQIHRDYGLPECLLLPLLFRCRHFRAVSPGGRQREMQRMRCLCGLLLGGSPAR